MSLGVVVQRHLTALTDRTKHVLKMSRSRMCAFCMDCGSSAVREIGYSVVWVTGRRVDGDMAGESDISNSTSSKTQHHTTEGCDCRDVIATF